MEPGMAMPGFLTSLPPGRERLSGTMRAVNTSGFFEPALDGTCVLNCQTSWSTCISGCQWWEWLVGSCVPKCRVEWFACLGRC
jgi:hypothetical protein